MPRAKKKEGFAGRTHIGLVWDESGSMAHLKTQGDEFIDDQLGAARAHDTTFTLVKFGSQFPNGAETTWDAVDPHSVTSKDANYIPSGSTPMYDGIGMAVRTIEKKVETGDRALIVIFTDGFENASREWDEDKVKKLIADKEGEGNWSFVYTAAGLDEWQARQVAMAMGVSAQSIQSTPHTPVGMRTNSGTTASGTSNYLSASASASRSFYGGEAPINTTGAAPAEDLKEKKPRVKS